MTNTVSNLDAGCEGDWLSSLQTQTATAVKTVCLTSRLQFDQDSLLSFIKASVLQK